jgi:chromosomal replication initiation ATPase DnaA
MTISYWVIPALSTRLKKPTKKKIDFIIDLVCEKMCLHNRNLILNPNRTTRVAFSRHFVCYLLYYGTSMSLNEIANVLNKKDHSTIVNSLKVCKKVWDNDKGYPYYDEFRELLDLLSINPPNLIKSTSEKSKKQKNYNQ